VKSSANIIFGQKLSVLIRNKLDLFFDLGKFIWS